MTQVIVLESRVKLACLCVSAVVCVRAEHKPEQRRSESQDRSSGAEVTSARGFFHSLWVNLADCIICSKWI